MVCIGNVEAGFKVLTPKLVDLKAAFVHVKMNVTLVKIGSAGLPNLCFRMQSLDRKPSTVSDPLAVFFWRDEKGVELIDVRLVIYV